MTGARDRDLVFNLVWTTDVFPYLSYFVLSQLHHCAARFRFVANGCRPDEIDAMSRLASRFPDRVVEVHDASPSEMLRHGVILDAMLAERDDGPYFCFIDTDIKARGPFLDAFWRRLDDGCAAITSGRAVWTDDDRLPVGHVGVSGEYFTSPDGYLFGSPHFGIYDRRALRATTESWGAGFGSPGPDLPDATRRRLAAAGHDYWLYDTGKVVNILFQEDGHTLCHQEHPNLLHIGGVSHHLSTPALDAERLPESVEPRWARRVREQGDDPRLSVAAIAAGILRELVAGHPAPALPDHVAPELRERLALVRAELVDLVETYG